MGNRGRDSKSVSLVVTTGLLATIAVWLPAFPPMTDLPQHAAQVALLRAVRSADFPYASLFQVNWFTPYLLGHLLIYVLVPLVGMVGALKLVIAGALAAMPWATTTLMKETDTDCRWALLTIPGMYGFSYQLGFLNFIVAAPLGVYFVALALRHAREPQRRRAVALAILTLVLFFSHALVCAFFGTIAFLVLLSTAKTGTMAIRRVIPLMVVVPFILLWIPRVLAHPLGGSPMSWLLGWYRLPGSLIWTLGQPINAAMLLVGLALVALPLVAGGRLRPVKAWIPFLVCVATLAFAPIKVLGTAFVFPRFAWLLLPFYFVAFDPPHPQGWPRWVWPACLVVVGTWISVVVTNVRRYDKESAPFANVLTTMEPGQRAVWFAIEPDSAFAAAPYLHFGSRYTALRGGLVDPSMASAHTTAVSYKPEYQPAIQAVSFELHPASFDWKKMGASQYRYFFARSSTDPGPLISRNAPCALHLTYHADQWWLYERDAICPDR